MSTDNELGRLCLVTGAAGFVGRALVGRLLERGHSVRALLRRPTAVLPPHLVTAAPVLP